MAIMIVIIGVLWFYMFVQNVIEAMRALAIYSDILYDQGRDTAVSEENQEIRDRVAQMSDKQKFTAEHFHDFNTLWNDEGIRKTLKFKHMFQLIDTAEYLFENMEKYYHDDYIPTFKDLVHSRQVSDGQITSTHTMERMWIVFD